MIRRAFLQRAATIALGCGMLGIDLRSRSPEVGPWEQTTVTTGDLVFELGESYTIETDFYGPQETLTGCVVTGIESDGANYCRAARTTVGFEGPDISGVLTFTMETP